MGSSIGDRLSSVQFGGMNGGSDIGRKIRRVLGLIAIPPGGPRPV